MVFVNHDCLTRTLLDMVKKKWSWIKSEVKYFSNNFDEWSSQPVMCVGVNLSIS